MTAAKQSVCSQHKSSCNGVATRPDGTLDELGEECDLVVARSHP